MQIAKWISFSWVEFVGVVELVRQSRSLGRNSVRINLFRPERRLRNDCREMVSVRPSVISVVHRTETTHRSLASLRAPDESGGCARL